TSDILTLSLHDALPISTCPVILLSGIDDTRFVKEALRVGVRGFVQKSQGCDDLVHAIEEVRGGRLYVSPGASQAIVDACASHPRSEEHTSELQSRSDLV